MINRLRQHTISFKHAFEGLGYAFCSQPNFQIHFLAGILVVGLGWYYQIQTIDWIVLFLTIGLVLVAELLNTALESIVDLITTELRYTAKIAKDVSAGMVLFAAITSVVVGYLIFSRYW